MVLSGSKGLADAVFLFLFCRSGSHQEIDGTKNLIGANPLVSYLPYLISPTLTALTS